MSSFFDKFPLIRYQISGVKYSSFQTVRNLLFRTSIIREALNNSSSYIKYIIKDGHTPEILAAKVYGDPQAHWIILYANDMLDAQYDSRLTSSVFPKYIANKYRSAAEADAGHVLENYEVISWTQNTTNPASHHHYEKVVRLENIDARTTTETRFVVNKSKLTDNIPDSPFDYYDNLAVVQDVVNLPIGNQDGETIVKTIYGNAITYYDYENELNETKRNIRIIKREYYNQIVTEFGILTNSDTPIFLRRVS